MGKKVYQAIVGAILLTGLLWPISWAEGEAIIRVGFLPIAANLPIYTGTEMGYFEQEGVKVKLEPVSVAQRIIEAIVGSSLEIGVATALTISMLRERGFDFVIIAPSNNAGTLPSPQPPGYRDVAPVTVLMDSPIKSARDLEGRKLAIMGLKTINWLYIVEWLARNGADPKKVEMVELPFPHMEKAVRTRLVDAANMGEPFASVAEAEGGVRVMDYPFSAISKDVVLGAWATRESWIRAHGQEVHAFVRGIRKAIDYLNTHPQERTDILLRHIKMAPEVANRMHWTSWRKEIELAAMQEQIDLGLKWGLINKRQKASDLLYETAR